MHQRGESVAFSFKNRGRTNEKTIFMITTILVVQIYRPIPLIHCPCAILQRSYILIYNVPLGLSLFTGTMIFPSFANLSIFFFIFS